MSGEYNNINIPLEKVVDQQRRATGSKPEGADLGVGETELREQDYLLPAGDGASIDDYPIGEIGEQGVEKKVPKKEALDQSVAQRVCDYSNVWLENILDKIKEEKEKDEETLKTCSSGSLTREEAEDLWKERILEKTINFRNLCYIADKDNLCQDIALLVGEEEKYREGYLPSQYREGIKFFLETLICFFQERSGDKEQKDQLDQFQHIIQELLFSYSPNITNEIGISNLLIMAAKANRVPEAQGWFGQTMVGEMVYELAFADPEVVKNISEKVLKLPLAEVLDLIHQCQTIAADAVANGSWAENAIDRIKLIVEIIQKNTLHPWFIMKRIWFCRE